MADLSVYGRLSGLQDYLDINRKANADAQIAQQEMMLRQQKLRQDAKGSMSSVVSIVNEMEEAAKIAQDPNVDERTRLIARFRYEALHQVDKSDAIGKGMTPEIPNFGGQAALMQQVAPMRRSSLKQALNPQEQSMEDDLAAQVLPMNNQVSNQPMALPTQVSQAPSYAGVKSVAGFGEIQAQREGMKEAAKLQQKLQYEPVIAEATKTAQLSAERGGELAKKEVKAADVISQLKEAKTVLPKATSSGAGALLGVGKRFVGYSSEQTQADKQLDLVGGWLTSNVPRMEGPQGVADVELYKTMAGAVADSSTPIGDRQAAVAILEKLMSKYNVDKFSQGEQSFNDGKKLKPGRLKYNPATGELK